jgi:transcriptional regulator with XRE-family HTH domain
MKQNPVSSEKLREAILKSDLSQTQLARRVGLSDVCIHRYVTGLRKPGPSNLVKLSRALGVDVRDLMNGEN